MNAVLELDNVSKVYREGDTDVLAVDSVSLDLAAGEVLLLMGPSGSGKTTLLSMMGCILRPSSGNIRINGGEAGDLAEADLPNIRKKYFGFVFQAYNLFPSLTVFENVELALRMKNVKATDARERVMDLLDKVGILERSNFYPGDLSGGQKQRVAFARALAGDPPIILADEPTANLDSRKGNEVLELLRIYAKEYGKAVAVVSHDQKSEAVADRIIVLEDGKVRT